MPTDTELRILRKKLQDYNSKCEHLYLDDQGRVCVGIAHVLPTLEAALGVAFVNKQGLRASHDEIAQDYQAVKGLTPNRIPSFYKRYLTLAIPPSEMERLTNESVAQYFIDLATIYPEFESFPSEAKLALGDIIFSMGKDKLVDWLQLNESILAQDWQKASLDSARGFPVTAARNIYVQGLFERAHRASKARVRELAEV